MHPGPLLTFPTTTHIVDQLEKAQIPDAIGFILTTSPEVKMDKYFGEWVPYTGNGAIILGVVLLVIAGVFTLLGFKLNKSLSVKQPGRAMAGMLVAIWILAINTFLANSSVYALYMQQINLIGTPPENPITIFTLSFAFISFLIIFQINVNIGVKTAFWSAVLAAMAGPMVFELPFDLIIMSRTYPPIPTNPALFIGLYFIPLFSIELTTISLLFLSPLMKVTRQTLFSIAGMFLVFAIWGFLSFSFAYTTEFLILNVVAKALAFVTVITLFLPQKTMNSPLESAKAP
jgi:hypothetical protein